MYYYCQLFSVNLAKVSTRTGVLENRAVLSVPVVLSADKDVFTVYSGSSIHSMVLRMAPID
jgi:hypothetical protein